jgi:hypothetical protein
MVTNSFVKRNFMQSMGRPKHALKVPLLFIPFKFGGGVGRGVFFFPQVVFGVESGASSDKINEVSEDVYKLILYTILASR